MLGNPLLADFGLAKIQKIGWHRSYPNFAELREDQWLAPEVIIKCASGWTTDHEITTMSDVYAFALLCLVVCYITQNHSL